ncbi:DUF4956 domain-containing protein [Streptomyces alfalfae]|uniref:DUF4956 domain-containing protein n=1 Tax=Streptomyces alfalfae TaxID=1642299 RepID=A0ABM6GT81_9ACTN|nr:DUF4956 domain-containing protein [Streptomyces alfalfae]APY87226.1 DUF4956 domain-containing protein [Streptomyces alfalfae]AYA17630.1 DUF4956 domain-containing protein [Streptomyces fradiae]RXX44841.1 DUF4956 domain-containing protein [Streptomyces alfalfae]RZM95365.1 DUF4956 domain-containing protein [Streptomyces alfalfae]
MDSTLTLSAHLAVDLAAVTLLTFGVFYPRHRRRELVPAYLALNVALFAVVAGLGTVGGDGGLALGFGLFGVLSIVRLRSDALQHQEVAYYFITLVLGLLCGLPALDLPVASGLAAVLLLVMYGADHPRLFAHDRRTVITLDAVYREETALRAELARRLGEPLGWTVREVDYVRDLMVLEVRYRQPEPSARAEEFSRRTASRRTPEEARRRTTRSRTLAPSHPKETV